MPQLRLVFFGSARVDLEGGPLEIERKKTLAILAYLATTHKEHSREALATFFWPEASQERAFANLRRALWELNDRLGGAWLVAGREKAALADDPSIWVDVSAYQALVERAAGHRHTPGEACPTCITWLEEAARLYKGDFLAGLNLKDSPAFDDWRFFTAEQLKRNQVAVLDRLQNWFSNQGEYEKSVEYGRQWVFIDPLDEQGHRALMQAFALDGQRKAALRQFQECARILETELGAEPEPATRQLEEQVRAGQLSPRPPAPHQGQAVPPGQPACREAVAPPERPVNLPSWTTPFIGREVELGEVARLLADPACRLLTVLGPGGVGKTRLALQAAGLAGATPSGDHFQHGVYFIPLSHLTASDPILLAIAAVLGLKPNTDAHLTAGIARVDVQIVDFIRDRQILLLMDNFEHLAGQAPALSELLEAAPGLKILATSRQRLNLREEWVFEIHGMQFPAAGELPEEQAIDSYSAVAVFLEAARRTRVDFALKPTDRPCLARICQIVEGLPLALELAAAWTRILSCCEIAQEIESNLDFLSAPLRNLPDRQRSIRAIFEHSWALLTPVDQSVFRRLSVFQGGFSREAAIAITGATLPQIVSLADQSLIQICQACQNIPKYTLHELLKQYAAEKLQASHPEHEQTLAHHARYYCDLLSGLELKLKGAGQREAIELMRTDIENIRQAWRWAIQEGMGDEIRRASLSLMMYYDMTGQFEEGFSLFQFAVEQLRDRRRQNPEDRSLKQGYAFALVAACLMSGPERQIDPKAVQQEVVELLPEKKEIADWVLITLLMILWRAPFEPDQTEAFVADIFRAARQDGDIWLEANASLAWGDYLAHVANDPSRGQALRLQALGLFKRLGNDWGAGVCLVNLAHTAYLLGDYPTAEGYVRENLDVQRLVGDRWRIGNAYLTLGQLAVARGDYPAARQHYMDSMTVFREIGNRIMIGVLCDCVGYTEMHLGEVGQAEQRFWGGHELYTASRHLPGMTMSLVNLGDIARLQGDDDLARRRYEEALEIIQDYPGHERLWETMSCYRKLGKLAADHGEVEKARANYRQALWIAWYEKRYPEVIDLLVKFAALMTGEEVRAQRLELLTMCLAHPSLAEDTRLEAEQALREMGITPADLPEYPEIAPGEAVDMFLG